MKTLPVIIVTLGIIIVWIAVALAALSIWFNVAHWMEVAGGGLMTWRGLQ